MAGDTVAQFAQEGDTVLLARYDALQEEARIMISQGQRMAQQAAMLHVGANEKEKEARSLFDARLVKLHKGTPGNKNCKAPERHARDLAIFTMAGIVRPQNAESFAEDCAEILAPAMAFLCKDLESQLKNASQQNVIFVDAQQKVVELLLTLKRKKREERVGEERGRAWARGIVNEA